MQTTPINRYVFPDSIRGLIHAEGMPCTVRKLMLIIPEIIRTFGKSCRQIVKFPREKKHS